jgi:hypothetical protein
MASKLGRAVSASSASPVEPDSSSMSRISLEIEFTRTGQTASAEIYRHLSPATVNILIRTLPSQGRVYRFEDKLVYFVLSDVVTGVEKGKKDFNRGDVAFMSMNSGLCFITKECSVARPFNPLGRVVEGMDLFDSTRPGDTAKIMVKNEGWMQTK